MKTNIVWLQRDLRLADNPALHEALQQAEQTIIVYIHAPQELAPWQPGAASRWWLHHSLEALQQAITSLGAKLIIRQGPSLHTLLGLCSESKADAVYWNQCYTPQAIRRDQAIREALTSCGVSHHCYNGSLLHTPGSILNKEGKPYRVFAAFWNAAQGLGLGQTPLAAPQRLADNDLHFESVASLRLLPKIQWDNGLRQHWRPGAVNAHKQLYRLCDEILNPYPEARDYPAIEGTSRLSPYLAFGELSPGQVVAALLDTFMNCAIHGNACDSFMRQLGWREFAHHTLYHFPEASDQALNSRFAQLPWQNNPSLLKAWQQGRTGYPIIDAGMRELWHTGWMHNRVRMIVASFITKNGMIPWLLGARWFWDTLVDADLASNSFNWQWVAGTGLDAAPYFRIFNPIRQSQKFDKQGCYLRRWLPELAALPDEYIHTPWQAPANILNASNIRLGIDYPRPSLDLAMTRRNALASFDAIKSKLNKHSS